jgi:hypothetical protein
VTFQLCKNSDISTLLQQVLGVLTFHNLRWVNGPVDEKADIRKRNDVRYRHPPAAGNAHLRPPNRGLSAFEFVGRPQ